MSVCCENVSDFSRLFLVKSLRCKALQLAAPPSVRADACRCGGPRGAAARALSQTKRTNKQ